MPKQPIHRSRRGQPPAPAVEEIYAQARAETERTWDHLRAYVAASGLSEDEVARKADVRPAVLSGLTVRGVSLRLDVLLSVLKALDVLPGTFFASLYGLAARGKSRHRLSGAPSGASSPLGAKVGSE